MIGVRISQIEEQAALSRLTITYLFGEYVREHRLAGKTYREIADAERVHPATIRRYVKWFERCYGSADDLAPKSNAVSLTCVVCDERFETARADRRFCSNACRQDAYRHRKAGAA